MAQLGISQKIAHDAKFKTWYEYISALELILIAYLSQGASP